MNGVHRFFILASSLTLLAACGQDDDGPSGGNAGSAGVGGAGGSGGGAGSSGSGGNAGSSGGGGSGGSGGSAGAPVTLAHYLYVANRDSDTIDIFEIGAAGELSSAGSVDVDGPAPLAVSPDNKRLYAGLTQSSQVAAYEIDFATGALSPIGTSDLGIRPVYVAVDATGKHLLVASYSDDEARVLPIAGDGSVGETPESTHSPGTNPHAIITDPSNQWAFVPVTNSDRVAQYAFDASTGSLSENQPAFVDTGNAVGPRHLVFHPSLPRLYVVNEHADSVTVYAFDATQGTLDALETESTLPSGVNGSNNTCADIHVTPDGKFVYASNRGHDSLAGFAVDATSGELTPIGHTPTEPIPREFEITPDGKFVYSAGQQSGKLAAYAVQNDGSLTPIGDQVVGSAPLWVLAISVPQD